MNEVARHAADTLHAVGSGDVQSATNSATQLSATFIGWWAWSNFYRWVIGTNIALLIATGGLAGTVLLFEQNKRLREQTNELIEQRKELKIQGGRADIQSELIALSLVSDFREHLRTTTEQSNISSFNPNFSSDQCTVRGKTENHNVPSNLSAINALADLATSSLVEEKVVAALVSLAEDSNHSVRLGAVMALDRTGKIPRDFSASFQNVFMNRIVFDTKMSLEFSGSYIGNIQCPNCELGFSDSVVGVSGSMVLSADRSFVFSNTHLLQAVDESLTWTSDLTHVALAQDPPMYTGSDGWNVLLGGFFLENR